MKKCCGGRWPLLIVVAVVIADQLSKWQIMARFRLYESKAVIAGLFNLTYITNTGAAFGMMAGEAGMVRQIFFLGVGVVALIALFILYRHQRDKSCYFTAGIGLIAGGAVGNMIDRVRFGSVVDFLDFYVQNHHWPAFNLADSAITIGVGLLLVDNFLRQDDGLEVEG